MKITYGEKIGYMYLFSEYMQLIFISMFNGMEVCVLKQPSNLLSVTLYRKTMLFVIRFKGR